MRNLLGTLMKRQFYIVEILQILIVHLQHVQFLQLKLNEALPIVEILQMISVHIVCQRSNYKVYFRFDASDDYQYFQLLLNKKMKYWSVENIYYIRFHIHIITNQFIYNIFMYIFTQVKLLYFPKSITFTVVKRCIQRYMYKCNTKKCT